MSRVCGINLICGYGSAAPAVDQEELRLTSERLRRRGPDGSGSWISPDGRVGMAHRRLSIIDLSNRASQPMRHGQHVLVYNGEIYNHRELRSELEGRGRTFITRSDSEVLLQMFDEYGAAMLPRLRGMFAFAIWSESARSLFLARDAIGIKPLYFSDDGSTLRVASQVKALLAGGAISRSQDLGGIASFYLLGCVAEPRTIYSAIRALPAGSHMTIRGGEIEQPVRWYSTARLFLDAEAEGIEASREGDHGEELRDAVSDSLAAHLIADVPSGFFLSGGIDSGALLGLAADLRYQPLRALTIRFNEYSGSNTDESGPAAATARSYGATHEVSTVRREDFLAVEEDFFDSMDQPTTDATNSFIVSRAASAAGWKVAISGTGGDELLGGYSSFKKIPQRVRLTRVLGVVPGLSAVWKRLIARAAGHSTKVKPSLGSFLEYYRSYPAAYFLKRALYLPQELPQIMGVAEAEEGLRLFDPVRYFAEVLSPMPQLSYSRIAVLEYDHYLRNRLLRDIDWASMAHGLEIRVPLIDAVLMRKLIPRLIAFPERRKGLLARAPSLALPGQVISRRKTGFNVPIRRWIHERDGETVAHGMRTWSQEVLRRYHHAP